MSIRLKLVVVVTICACLTPAMAVERVLVVDDRDRPVRSTVLIDDTESAETDHTGAATIAPQLCTTGKHISARALTNAAGYLPAKKVPCAEALQQITVRLVRRVLLMNTNRWLELGRVSSDQGLQAHALNEQYVLVRVSDRARAEAIKRQMLTVSAEVVGVDPALAVRKDEYLGTNVMTDEMAEAVVNWKIAKGISKPTAALDYDFFSTASNKSSAVILYTPPPGMGDEIKM